MSIASEIRTSLLSIVAEYRRATGLSLATVSARFYGNAGFLKEFKRSKQTISIDKLDKVVEQFRREWPENANWPFLGAIIIKRP